jgi:hypothetical protein
MEVPISSTTRRLLLMVSLLLGFVIADDQDLLAVLEAQSSLSIFTSLFREHTSLFQAAQAGNLTGKKLLLC